MDDRAGLGQSGEREAERFLRHTHSEDRVYRFDIIAITVLPDGTREIEHLLEAFTPA